MCISMTGTKPKPRQEHPLAPRERELHQGPNLIQDSNPDFRRIAAVLYWIHSLVGVSHFTKYRKNRLMTV